MKIGLVSLSDDGNFLNHKSYESSIKFLVNENIDFKNFIITTSDKNSIVDNLYKACESDVDLIWIVAGGDKIITILNLIDWNIIKKSQKTFLGFSDFTHFAYLANIYKIPCYYGPGLKNILNFYPNKESQSFILNFLKDGIVDYGNFETLSGYTEEFEKNSLCIGGHLSIFTFMQGLYKQELKNKYLFIEYHPNSKGEELENLEYYINQLHFVLELTSKPKGFILGCSMIGNIEIKTINDLFIKSLGKYNLPIFFINHFSNIIKF